MTRTFRNKPSSQRLRTRDFLIPVVAGFVLLVLLQALVGRMYVIPSASMEPTLHGCAGCKNDRIAVQKVSYYFTDPKPGEVVVLKGPSRGITSLRSIARAIFLYAARRTLWQP